MLRVMFVDDDMLTLNRLREMVDWQELGYEVAGQAMDGEAALSLAEKIKPDLVILDVNMPRLDGISVIKALRERMPSACVLMLSNYDTFEYVRLTMRHGACDYLLKHELTAELLTKKLGELSEKRRREAADQRGGPAVTLSGKQQHLKELVLTGAQDDPVMAAQPEFNGARSLLCVMRVKNFDLFTLFDGEPERKRLSAMVVNLASNVLANLETGLVTALEDGRFAVLFSFGQQASPQKVRNQGEGYMRMLADNLSRVLNLSLEYQLSDPAPDISQLHAAFRRACQKLTEAEPFSPMSMEERRWLTDALGALDTVRAERVLTDILKNHPRGAALELMRISQRWCENMGLVPTEGYLHKLQNAFRTPQSPERTAELLRDHYRTLIGQALAAENSRFSPHVRDAIAFIHAGYMRDVSLSEAAERTGVSPEHLSRQFSRETGASFVDYLTAHRIKVARELLKKPGATVMAVCRQVGFHNYSYFLKVFKKTTGQTIGQTMGGEQKE